MSDYCDGLGRCAKGFAAANVPTNTDLAERAKTKTAHEVVRNWLERHRSFAEGAEYQRWLDWAADNFLADPEIRQHIGEARP